MKSPADWSKEEAEDFLRKVVGEPVKILEGKEYEHVRTMLALMEPANVDISSQRAVIEIYEIGNDTYRVTHFSMNEDPEIELISKEEE